MRGQGAVGLGSNTLQHSATLEILVQHLVLKSYLLTFFYRVMAVLKEAEPAWEARIVLLFLEME